MGIRKKFEGWILKEEFNQDTFQTFVCWMLFGSMVCSFFTPAWLVLFQAQQKHCVEGTFTILAHFRIHSWLYEMFEDFKDYQDGYDSVCFELIISDSQFSEDSEPSLWIPENLVWLDEAEDDDNYGSELVSNETKYCKSTANVPMGLVTWKTYAEALNYNEPFNYSDFLDLANIGWNNFTNGEISWDEFIFSHAHPNVTSSGVLGMVLGVQAQGGGNPYSYTKASFENNYADKIKNIENGIYELGPNELTVLSNFLGHGPDYIHAMYGFENAVAYANYLYKDLLNALWDDTLAFVYFESTFWMTHPACVLDQADWVDDDDNLYELAINFQEYISNSTRKSELLEWGIRPYGISQSDLQDSEVISSEYGVNPNITNSESVALNFPDYDTVESLRYAWQDLKLPVYLRILIDTSFFMQSQLSGSSITRWSFAIENLDYFATVLEDDAVFDLKCFTSNYIDCGDQLFPNGTLSETREDIIDYFEDEVLGTSSQSVTAAYRMINQSVTDLRYLKANETDTHYNYILVVISEDNVDDDDETYTADDLLDSVGINYAADDIHIFPICFWCEDDETKETFSEIAVRTNGEYYETQKGMPDILEEIGWYF